MYFCLGTEVLRLSAGSILSTIRHVQVRAKKHVLRVRACVRGQTSINFRGGAKIMQMARASHPVGRSELSARK